MADQSDVSRRGYLRNRSVDHSGVQQCRVDPLFCVKETSLVLPATRWFLIAVVRLKARYYKSYVMVLMSERVAGTDRLSQTYET